MVRAAIASRPEHQRKVRDRTDVCVSCQGGEVLKSALPLGLLRGSTARQAQAPMSTVHVHAAHPIDHQLFRITAAELPPLPSKIWHPPR